MPDRVADASVVAAAAFREPRADEASGLLDEATIFAPPLLSYELTSVARKKARQQPERAREITELLRMALGLAIRWAGVDHPLVLSLALTTGLSSYDATYLHVAQSLRLPLVTFDRRLQVAADELGIASIEA